MRLCEFGIVVMPVSAAVRDQIGGWTTDGVGQGYGSGYPLDVLNEWVEKTILHFGQYTDAAR